MAPHDDVDPTPVHVDPGLARELLAALDASVARALPLPDALGLVVESSHRLFGLTGSGLLVFDERDVLRHVASSDDSAHELEVAQERTLEGPCVDAAVGDDVVATPDVTDDPRWPELGQALTDHRVRAVLGVPIHLDGRPVGSLNVYSALRHEWDGQDRAAMEAYGKVVDRILEGAVTSHAQDTLVAQLQHALESRIVIERAIGALMERDGCDSELAFERLRRIARGRRERVSQLAQRVLDGESLD